MIGLSTKRVNISSIRIEERHRRDLGDIDGLAATIELLGLLQPIVLDSKHRLLAGERRLRACQILGWSEIEAKVMQVCRNGDSHDEG